MLWNKDDAISGLIGGCLGMIVYSVFEFEKTGRISNWGINLVIPLCTAVFVGYIWSILGVRKPE